MGMALQNFETLTSTNLPEADSAIATATDQTLSVRAKADRMYPKGVPFQDFETLATTNLPEVNGPVSAVAG